MGVEVARLDCLFPVRWASRGIADYTPGMTVQDVAPPATETGNWGAIVNGKNLHRKDWSQPVPDNSQIIFTPLPADVVAIGAFLYEVLVYTVVSLAVNFALSKILGVPEVQQFEGGDTNTYTFQNLQQTAAAGVSVNIVYGSEHPVAGNVLELDLKGNNPGGGNIYGSTLDMTVGLCEGEIASVNSVTINGNDVANVAGLAEQYSNLGTNTQGALGSSDTTTTTTHTVNADLPFPVQTTKTMYLLRDCGLSGEGWTNGAPVKGVTITGGGGLNGTATVWDAGVNQSGSTDQVLFYDASPGSNLTDNHGQDCGTTIGTVTAPVSNGNTTLTVMRSGGTVPFGNFPILLENDTPVSYTTTQDVDSVRLNIKFPDGLYSSNNSGIQSETARVQYRYKDVDAVGTFSEVFQTTITNDQLGPWLYTIDVPLPAKATYEFEIWDFLYHDPETSDGYRMNLDSVVEVVDQVYTYPNLATLRLVINSDTSVSGGLPNVIAKVTGRKITKWDGASTSSPNFVDASPYDNPAWIVYDLLTNTRYGLGNWIDVDAIDLQSFKNWADWCDELVPDGSGGSEKRATWNGIIDGGSSAWDSALAICASARATLMTLGEAVRVKFERERTPTQLFNMANIIEGTYAQSYISRLERPTRVDVQFLNAAANYQVDVVGEDDADAIAAGLPQRVLRIELPGVTRESQARREARFRLNVEKLGTVVSWESDIDAVACEPGDLVWLQHDLPQWGEGGRVKAAGSTSITLDRDVTLADGSTYKVLVRHGDDSREEKTISSNAGTYTAGTAISVDGTWGTTPNAGDLYTLGILETYAKEIVVSNITTTGNLTRKLEGVLYDASIHEDNIETAASTFIDLPNPQQIPGQVSNLAVTELKTPSTQAAVSWSYPTDTAVASAKVWSRPSASDPYLQIGTAEWPAAQTILPFRPGVSQEITVTAVSPSGAHLPPTSTTPVTFEAGGAGSIPSAPTNVSMKQDDDRLEISWEAAAADRYEVRRGLSWIGSQAVGTTSGPNLITTEWCPTLSSGVAENYMVRGVKDGRFGSVGTVTDSNDLSIWTGGSSQVEDFSDSQWSGVTLSNMSIVQDGGVRVVKMTTPGTLAKLQTDTFDAGSLATHRIGLISHAEFESDIWASAGYAWNSETGARNAWGGIVDPAEWSTAVAFQFRTRTSSSAAWTAWRPLTSRVTATTFREIQVLAEFRPTEAQQSITLRELILVVET